MISRVKRQIEMLEGVPPFAHKPGITLNAEATALVTSIETVLVSLNTLASNQVSGGAEFHAGTDAKEIYVEQMLVYMRGISKVARELPELGGELARRRGRRRGTFTEDARGLLAEGA